MTLSQIFCPMLNVCVKTRKGDTNLTNYLSFAGCWPVGRSGDLVSLVLGGVGHSTLQWLVTTFTPPNHSLKQVWDYLVLSNYFIVYLLQFAIQLGNGNNMNGSHSWTTNTLSKYKYLTVDLGFV